MSTVKHPQQACVADIFNLLTIQRPFFLFAHRTSIRDFGANSRNHWTSMRGERLGGVGGLSFCLHTEFAIVILAQTL